MMYKGVSGNTYNIKHRLGIGEIRLACGSIRWSSISQGEEFSNIWFGRKKFTPRVHQYLQGFLRSKKI